MENLRLKLRPACKQFKGKKHERALRGEDRFGWYDKDGNGDGEGDSEMIVIRTKIKDLNNNKGLLQCPGFIPDGEGRDVSGEET
jgi:hypothetical protein